MLQHFAGEWHVVTGESNNQKSDICLFIGIYIPMTDMSAPTRYRGIGIRIEDDILITDEEPINLSEECPKEMEEIETLMAR